MSSYVWKLQELLNELQKDYSPGGGLYFVYVEKKLLSENKIPHTTIPQSWQLNVNLEYAIFDSSAESDFLL